MMSRISVLAMIAVGIFSANIGFAQDIIENPAKPLAANADRKVELKEVLRITDESGKFYFKYPYGIAVGPDGSIFVAESEQLLQFDKTGKYVRNYFKKGQGPGEVQSVSGFIPTDKGLYVHGSSGKLIFFDAKGAFVKETALRSLVSSFSLTAIQDGLHLFTASESPFKDMKGSEPAVISIPQYVLTWKEGQGQLEKCGEFGMESYVIRSGGGGGVLSLSTFHVVPMGSGRLILSHTQEYLLKIFDIGSGSVTKSFRRPYERIRFEPPNDQKGGVRTGGNLISWPTPKYLNDIVNICVVGSRIWVVTSTKDKDQNPPVDVYDFDGRYLDRFYLTRPAGAKRLVLFRRNSVIQGRNLYLIERDEEGTVAIVKYEIIDPGAAIR
jgi:hypothetical protein